MKNILGSRTVPRLSISICAAALIGISLVSDVETHQAAPANGSVQYTYGALGRVTTATYDTNKLAIYSYDANGNRAQQVIKVTATPRFGPVATSLREKGVGPAEISAIVFFLLTIGIYLYTVGL